MATVYLHIGHPKTGTTAIQNFLCNNAGALGQHGICFPDFGFRYPKVSFRRNAHFLAAEYDSETHTADFSRPSEDYQKAFEQISELAKTYDRILLSEELLWRIGSNDPDFWTNTKADFDRLGLELKVIAYLRRQDLFVQSRYRQRIKTGETFSFYEFLNTIASTAYPLDFYTAAEKICSVVGKENLIIRIYEKGQFQGAEHTLLSDFLDIFGLSITDGFHSEDKAYNLSYEGTYLEMKRFLNALPEPVKKASVLSGSFREIHDSVPYALGVADRRSLFAPGEQEAFLAQYLPSNERLAREYLGREDGILFYDPFEELPQEKPDLEELLRDTILVYGRAIQKLDRSAESMERQAQRLEAEIQKLHSTSSLRNRIKRFLGKA